MLSAKSQKTNSKPNLNAGKGKGKGKEKGKGKKDVEIVDLKDELLEEDDDEDDDLELFWNMKVIPNEENLLEPPHINGIVCVTNACFGDDVKKDSRTVICCKTPFSEDATPICVLNQGSNENQRVNLKFGSAASFTLQGRDPSTVYLTGFIDPEDMRDMDEFPEDFDMEETPSKYKYPSMEEDEFPAKPAAKKRKVEAVTPKKAEEKKQPQKKETATPNNHNDVKADAPKSEDKPLSKNQQKKLKKLQKQQAQQVNKDNKSKEEKDNNEVKETTSSAKTPEKTNETPNDKSETKEQNVETSDDQTKTQKKNADVKLPNGVEYKDIKVGTGEEIKNGQTVSLYYVGQLENKKVFDKVLSGDGFEYKFGSEEPVKGWNIALQGMKVGSKRRIVLPPKFAYGDQGLPDKVPENSTVTFTVEIKNSK